MPRKMKINKNHITLKLLTICEIVTSLEKCSTDSALVRFQLPLPPVICFDIEQEIDCQRSLLQNIIAPTVEYKYENEY